MSAKWNNSKPGNKTWVHSATALTAGHVVYNVKYLGNVEVMGPKGADIVKEAVTKLKFNKQVKRSEGSKPPKRELTISVDGIAIQDKQSKEKQFQYPLHHISYCADDKSDKKVCAFIAKDVKENRHVCHVMESDKNAEEITLTVGQAFDLAYQKFLSSASKNQEQQQENESLQKRVEELEVENKQLKARIVELEVQQGLNPSYSIPANGEQEKMSSDSGKFNPFNSSTESAGSLADPLRTDSSIFPSLVETTQAPPTSMDLCTAVNLLADLNTADEVSDEPKSPSVGNTLAEQAAAYQASKNSGGVFEDTFNPSPQPVKPLEPLLPPPPPAQPRNVEPPSQIAVVPPPSKLPPEPQSPLPLSPNISGAQSSGIARSRPRPQAMSTAGVIAPPPRTIRRGDSAGHLSPPPTSPSPKSLGLDDLYAAVSRATIQNGSGLSTSTTSPNPFKGSPSSAQFGFGDNLDFLNTKGSSTVSTTNATSSSSSAFSILDLDPLNQL